MSGNWNKPNECPRHGKYIGTNCAYCDYPPFVEPSRYTPQEGVLRQELIDKIGVHQGWEESAVALVDECVLPVVRPFLRQPPGDEMVVSKAFDPTRKENWKYHDEYCFWYMEYPGTPECAFDEDIRAMSFEPWIAAMSVGTRDGSVDDVLISDYEQTLDDHKRLVRELDIALNGEEGAAEQASLCDIVAQVKAMNRTPQKTISFDEWCVSVKDCGHEVQTNSATARQRRLGWNAAMATKQKTISEAEAVSLNDIAILAQKTYWSAPCSASSRLVAWRVVVKAVLDALGVKYVE